MAKPSPIVNPNAPEDADAMVRQLIEANPAQLTPAHFRFRVYHLADPTSSTGRCLGNIGYERFSEEAVAQAFGVAGDFYADLQCASALAPGNLKRIRFGIAEQLIPRGTTPATLAGLAPAPQPAGSPIDLTALLLAQMKQQGDLIIALLGRPAAPASAPMSDRLVELLFSQAVTKTPAADLITFFDAMKKRTAAAEEADDEPDAPTGGSIGVELLRTLRALVKTTPQLGALPHTPPAAPTPSAITAAQAPEPAAAPHTIPPTQAASAASASESPGGVPTNAAGAQRVDPSTLGETERLQLFGRRVVPQLIDCATDPTPSIDAAAAMIEATAIRSGLDPANFAQVDDLAADIVDPVAAFYPELLPHREFAIAAVQAVADQYDDDDDEPGE